MIEFHYNYKFSKIKNFSCFTKSFFLHVLEIIGPAKCGIRSQRFYGYDEAFLDDCCAIKKTPFESTGSGNWKYGTEEKCGQFEGACRDENDCLPGYTCGKLVVKCKIHFEYPAFQCYGQINISKYYLLTYTQQYF